MAKKIAPYSRHLRSSQDLVTTSENTRAGFVSLALERNRRADKYVAQAHDLKVKAAAAANPQKLLTIDQIQAALLTAAGVSGKAGAHFTDEDKKTAIKNLIDGFLEKAGDSFVEELVFRFLLTCGDTLGGSMRNVGGVLAQRKFARALFASLTNAGQPFRWLPRTGHDWVDIPPNETEADIRGLAWHSKAKQRVLVYNVKIAAVRNNVDLSLLDCSSDELVDALKEPTRFLAFGELKGGIDPAGADEHWKTADTALSRIRRSLAEARLHPKTFFIGAAIARNMADEIWNQLKSGALANAANLTVDDQVASLCSWICEL